MAIDISVVISFGKGSKRPLEAQFIKLFSICFGFAEFSVGVGLRLVSVNKRWMEHCAVKPFAEAGWMDSVSFSQALILIYKVNRYLSLYSAIRNLWKQNVINTIALIIKWIFNMHYSYLSLLCWHYWRWRTNKYNLRDQSAR